jgi:hypothetical protein
MLDSQQQKENNEVIAHRFHMDIFQKGDLSVADEILDTNFVWRNPSIPSELAPWPSEYKENCCCRN